MRILEEKRRLVRDSFEIQPPVVCRVFLDTTYGLVLTSDAAMRAVEQQEQAHIAKYRAQKARKAAGDARSALESTNKRRAFDIWSVERAVRRLRLYEEPFALLPLIVRRKIAAERAAKKRLADLALFELRAQRV